MPVDKFGRMSDTKTKDTGVSLTYINNNYIRSDGGTPVTGSINMNGNTLYNVSDPENPQDVATNEYADNKRPHLIAIHLSYWGKLTRGEYQFTFGGTASKETGFLIPQSGRIKKIKFRLGDDYKHNEEGEKRSKALFNFFNHAIFSIMLFRKDESFRPVDDPENYVFEGGEPVNEIVISSYVCKLIRKRGFRQLCFVPNNDLKNYPLSEGDYINIRSESDLGSDDYVRYKFSFLFTFLIELDPLWIMF